MRHEKEEVEEKKLNPQTICILLLRECKNRFNYKILSFFKKKH